MGEAVPPTLLGMPWSGVAGGGKHRVMVSEAKHAGSADEAPPSIQPRGASLNRTRRAACQARRSGTSRVQPRCRIRSQQPLRRIGQLAGYDVTMMPESRKSALVSIAWISQIVTIAAIRARNAMADRGARLAKRSMTSATEVTIAPSSGRGRARVWELQSPP